MFNENSLVVKVWVKNVKSGTYEREQVPNIGNLRKVVYSVLDAEQEAV